MKILMLVPSGENYMMASVHRSLDHKREHRPLLGILSVATYLRAKRPRHELHFVDCRAREMSPDESVELVKELQPDVVGLTALTFDYYDMLRLARRIKREDPRVRICAGGWHVTLFPRETLGQSCIDYVVHGEGEQTFVELIDALESGQEPRGIPGIGYKSKDGTAVVNSSRDLERNLDAIDFPDFDLSDIHLYSHVLAGGGITLPMESSRGCPFGCTFCDMRRTHFRHRSPSVIVDEMARWVDRGIHSFFFLDDNITANKKRALSLFEEIADRKLRVEFKVSSRVDALDEELMESMQRAGVSRVSVGIESSKQKYLDYMQKGIRVEQIEACIQGARKVGLPVFAFMLIGMPGQTRKEMFEELDFLRAHKIDYANFSILTAYPKTELLRVALEAGELQDDPWPAFARNPAPGMQAPFVNSVYTPEQLRKIQLQLTRLFYFSPRILYRRLREVDSWRGFKMRARIAMRMLGADRGRSA